MNQRQRINKAIALVRPVLASVGERRPKGFSPRMADNLAATLRSAVHNLEVASECYSEDQVVSLRAAAAR